MKKLLFICSIIAATLTSTSCSKQSQIEKTVAEINKVVPMTVGYNRMDTCILDGKTVKIINTLLTDEISSVTEEQLQQGKELALLNAKNNKDFKIFIDNGCDFAFIYKKLDGSDLFQITLKNEELK